MTAGLRSSLPSSSPCIGTLTDKRATGRDSGDGHTYIHPSIHTYLHTYIPTYLHTYIPTYLHTYIHTYIHTYKYTIDTYAYGMKLHIYIYVYNICRYMTKSDFLMTARANCLGPARKPQVSLPGAWVATLHSFRPSSNNRCTVQVPSLASA